MSKRVSKLCPCGQEPRLEGQGYGRVCKAAAQRRFRQRRAAERKALIKQGVVPARRPRKKSVKRKKREPR